MEMHRYKYLQLLLPLLFVFYSLELFCQYDVNKAKWIDNIEEAMKAPERVYNLDLSNQSLEEIPAFLNEFPNLIALKLSDNNIDSLNENLSSLSNLEFLELSGNNIQHLDFKYLEKLKNSLIELWLRENRIEEIDSTINVLKYLEVLQVGNNQLKRIDDNIVLSNLKELVLDANYLEEVPKLLDHSPKISTLNVSANQMREFRLTNQMRNLINLNIGDNPLHEFVKEDTKFKLQLLILDWVDVKEDWLALFPSSLITLSLENCGLTDIKNLSHLIRLKQLSLLSNEIKSLSNDVRSLKRLEKIWIKGNDISAEEISDLERNLEVKN